MNNGLVVAATTIITLSTVTFNVVTTTVVVQVWSVVQKTPKVALAVFMVLPRKEDVRMPDFVNVFIGRMIFATRGIIPDLSEESPVSQDRFFDSH